MQFNFSFLSSTFLHWNSSFFTWLFGTHCQGNWHDLGQSACWIVCNVCCYNIKLLCIWCKNCECFLFSEKFWFEFSEIFNDKCNSIFHNFWKRVRGICQTFQNFLTGYFHSIWLCSQNFQIFRLNGLFSLETFPGNVCTIWSSYEIFGIFGGMESTHCFTSLDCHLISIPKCNDMWNVVWAWYKMAESHW